MGDLNKCGRLTQFAFIGFNFLYMLIGIAAIALGGYLVHSGHSFAFFTGNEFFSGAAILIICGCVIFLITGFGIVGALLKWKPVLYIYVVVVVIIVILEIAAAIVGFVLKDNIADSANSTAEGAINDYYPEGNENFDGSVNEAVDFVQETFECCGWNETSIWLTSPYYELTMMYPSSCECDNSTDADCMLFMDQNIYSTPCDQQLGDRLRTTVIGIGVGGLVFALLQVFPILLSCGLLYCLHNKKGEYVTV